MFNSLVNLDGQLMQVDVANYLPTFGKSYMCIFYGGYWHAATYAAQGDAIQAEFFLETPATEMPYLWQRRLKQDSRPGAPTYPQGGKIWMDICRNFPIDRNDLGELSLRFPAYDLMVSVSVSPLVWRHARTTDNQVGIDYQVAAGAGYAWRDSATMEIISSSAVPDGSVCTIGPAFRPYGSRRTAKAATLRTINGQGAQFWMPWYRHSDRLLIAAHVFPNGGDQVDTDKNMIAYALTITFCPLASVDDGILKEINSQLLWPENLPATRLWWGGIPCGVTPPIGDLTTLTGILADMKQVLHGAV